MNCWWYLKTEPWSGLRFPRDLPHDARLDSPQTYNQPFTKNLGALHAKEQSTTQGRQSPTEAHAEYALQNETSVVEGEV